MEIEIYHLIFTSAVIAFIIEIFTAGFVAGSAAVGLVFAGVANYMGFDAKWQLLSFSIGMTLSFFLIKPIIEKLELFGEKTKTNVDSFIGRKVKVLEKVDPSTGGGRGMIDGVDWKLESVDGVMNENEMVEIVAVDSIVLKVKSINK